MNKNKNNKKNTKKSKKDRENEKIRSSDWFTREGTQCHGGSYLDDNS